MVPTIVPAALGMARSDWPRWLRVAPFTVAATTAVGLSVFATLADLDPWRLVLGLAPYLALCCVEVALLTRLYAPTLARGTLRRPPTRGSRRQGGRCSSSETRS